MKNCRFTRTSRFFRWCAMFFYPAISVLLFAAYSTFLILVFRHELAHPLFMVFMFFVGTAGAWFSLRFSLDSYKFKSRKYSISVTSITIRMAA